MRGVFVWVSAVVVAALAACEGSGSGTEVQGTVSDEGGAGDVAGVDGSVEGSEVGEADGAPGDEDGHAHGGGGDAAHGDDAASKADEEEPHAHGTGTTAGHVHGLAFWKETEEIVLGTHLGVYRTESGSSQLVTLSDQGDFMGFTKDPFDPARYWGSGHWPAGGFGLWGFIESTDGGETWEEVSLTGQVDFHVMNASPDAEGLVAGVFGGKVWVSVDAGRTWETHAYAGEVHSLEVDDPEGPVLLVASSSGVDRVTVPSMASEAVVSAPVTGLGRAGDGYAYGTPDGDVHVCAADLEGCDVFSGPPAAAPFRFLGTPEDLYVLTADSRVYRTVDGGETWSLVVSGP